MQFTHRNSLRNRLLSILCLALSLWTAKSLGQVPVEREVDFTLAAQQFRLGNLEGAATSVDQLIAQTKDVYEFFELKALILREKKEPIEAEKIYQKLIQLRQQGGPLLTAPYFFELGVLAFEEKKYDSAKSLFTIALNHNFNIATSHFYLGLIHFQNSSWLEARESFQKVLAVPSAQLILPTRLHLAKIEEQLNNKFAAVRQHIASRKLANQILGERRGTPALQELAQKTISQFPKSLDGYSNSTLLGNVGVFTGYDSNVLSTPDTDIAAGAIHVGSATETLNYGVGYAGSPLGSLQLLPYYNGSINYNLTPETKSGQFFIHNVSLTATHAPLSLTNYGFKLETKGVLQSRNETGSYKYSPYSLEGNAGVFGRLELTPKWVIGSSVFFHMDKNYLDPLLTENEKRSGFWQSLVVFISKVETVRWWNPTLTLKADAFFPTGRSHRNVSGELFFNNSIFLNESLALIEGAGWMTRYFHSRPISLRTDLTPFLSLTAIYRTGIRGLTLLAQTYYTKNLSNIGDSRYSRFLITGGASYNF